MKNKKWISLAAAVVLAVTALPMGVFAAKKDSTEEKLTKVTLNEVAHSIFYAGFLVIQFDMRAILTYRFETIFFQEL